jgi:hypothetical protein
MVARVSGNTGATVALGWDCLGSVAARETCHDR